MLINRFKHLSIFASMLTIRCFAQSSSPNQETHNILCGIGYGEIPSYIVEQVYWGNPNKGLDWQIGYEWLSQHGNHQIGVGALYSGYYASGSEIYLNCEITNDFYFNYIAPQFIYNYEWKNSIWSMALNVGAGIGIETQNIRGNSLANSSSEMKVGVGVNASCRPELKISPKIKLFLSFGYIRSFMTKTKNDHYYINERIIGNWDKISVSIGIKYRF